MKTSLRILLQAVFVNVKKPAAYYGMPVQINLGYF